MVCLLSGDLLSLASSGKCLSFSCVGSPGVESMCQASKAGYGILVQRLPAIVCSLWGGCRITATGDNLPPVGISTRLLADALCSTQSSSADVHQVSSLMPIVSKGDRRGTEAVRVEGAHSECQGRSLPLGKSIQAFAH